GRVVADDQDDRVAVALEVRQPVEDIGKAEMDIRRGRVDAKLHAERPSELQLRLECLCREDVNRFPGDLWERHSGLDYPGPGALPEKSAPPQEAAHPQAQTPRAPRPPRSAGPDGVHLRPARRGRREDPAARPGEAEADPGQHL